MKWNDRRCESVFQHKKNYVLQHNNITKEQLSNLSLSNNTIKEGLDKYPDAIDYIELAYVLGMLRGIRITDHNFSPIILDKEESNNIKTKRM